MKAHRQCYSCSAALPRRELLLFFAFLLSMMSFAAAQHREGPHERDLREQPRAVSYERGPGALRRSTGGSLTHAVHGYHPYWIPDEAADTYRFELLSHLAYFSVEIDPASGLPTNTRGWLTSTVPARARAAGVKVLLTVTNFGAGANRSLLGNPVARDTLCASLLRLVRQREADGVSIDFESVPADQRENLVAFFRQMRSTLDAWDAGMVISAAVPAVDWSGSWDVAALSGYIDLFFIMGYDYSWSGSSSAGPVAPLRNFSLNVERTVDWYLAQGVPASRLLLGVPYYGYDWPVSDDRPQSPATDRAVSRIYSVVPDILAHFPRQWSESFSVPWIAYRPSAWRQCWYDDAQSLALKYDFVLDRGLAGVGMWALGYDGALTELWTELERAFYRTTGIVDAAQADAGLAIWPLPLRRGGNFSVRTADGTVADLTIFDLLGRSVFSGRSAPGGGLRCPDIAAGLYIARAVNRQGSSQRIIVIE